MEIKEKWYLNLYFICLLFAFSFLIIPLFLGVYLLNEKRKILYKEKIAFENTHRKFDETSLNYESLQAEHLQLEDKYNKVIERYSELDLNSLGNIKENIKQKNIEINDLNIKKSNLDIQYSTLSNEIEILTKEKNSISKEIHLLNNELEYIDLGFTKPLFDYNTSEIFKKELLRVKNEQKKLVSSGKAIDAPKKCGLMVA